MGSTNKTANIGLSQFIGTDKPTWLVDYNNDMSVIDEAIGELQNDSGLIDTAIAELQTNVQNLQSGQGDSATEIAEVKSSVQTLGANYETIHHEVVTLDNKVTDVDSKVNQLDMDKSNKLNPQIIFEHNGNESTIRRFGTNSDALGICTIKSDGTTQYGTLVNKEGEYLPDFVKKDKLTSLLGFKTINQKITLAQGEQKLFNFTAPSGMIIPTYATAVNGSITVINMYPHNNNAEIKVDVKNTGSSSITADLFVTCLVAK